MPDAEWCFDWHRTWDTVWTPEVETAWRLIFESSARAQVYHHPALVRAWAETCGRAAGVTPMIGIARSEDGACVLLPWSISQSRGSLIVRRQLGPVGADLFGYHDPLADAGASRVDWTAFWPVVRRSVSTACDQALFRFVHAEFAGLDAVPCGE